MPPGTVRPFLHDLYAPLAHVIGTGALPLSRGPGHPVPTWVDDVDGRRLLAYRALDAYLDNVHRFWLPDRMWQRDPISNDRGDVTGESAAAAEGFREYGHPALLVSTARSLLLGDEQTVTAMDPELAGDPAVVWSVGWAEAERVTAKVLEGEEATIGLGDGVYVLGWSARVARPRLRVFDPGMYFPDWAAVDEPGFADWDDEDFPPRVHLAWEYERDDHTWVRVTTWEMRRLTAPRAVPWSSTPVVWTCVQRVEEWRTDRLDGRTLYQLRPGSGAEVRPQTDLRVDFIPVVAVPNDYSKHKFGRSLLLRVVQLLDDLSAGDTDLAIDASLVASPPTVTQGVTSGLGSGPGAQWNIPDGGSVNLLDTSRTLDALLKYADRLEDLLSTRSRVAAVLLGKVTPADAASGYAMRLGLAPTQALLGEMEKVRKEKFPLLLKFAVRLAQTNGALAAGPTPVMRLDLSSGMPTARQAAIEEVQGLFEKRLISTATAVAMLRDAGVPTGDVDAEVARIVAERVQDAVDLVDATGDVAAARARLGLDPAPTPAPTPAPVPDPVP